MGSQLHYSNAAGGGMQVRHDPHIRRDKSICLRLTTNLAYLTAVLLWPTPP